MPLFIIEMGLLYYCYHDTCFFYQRIWPLRIYVYVVLTQGFKYDWESNDVHRTEKYKYFVLIIIIIIIILFVSSINKWQFLRVILGNLYCITILHYLHWCWWTSLLLSVTLIVRMKYRFQMWIGIKLLSRLFICA